MAGAPPSLWATVPCPSRSPAVATRTTNPTRALLGGDGLVDWVGVGPLVINTLAGPLAPFLGWIVLPKPAGAGLEVGLPEGLIGSKEGQTKPHQKSQGQQNPPAQLGEGHGQDGPRSPQAGPGPHR